MGTDSIAYVDFTSTHSGTIIRWFGGEEFVFGAINGYGEFVEHYRSELCRWRDNKDRPPTITEAHRAVNKRFADDAADHRASGLWS